MYSFKFYYVAACDSLNIKQNEKLLAKLEESTNTTNLNLSNIELTADTCKAIGHALSKDVFLQELDLSNCMLSDKGLSEILSGLEVNKFLLTLNLKGNNIRSSGAAVIGKLLRHNNHLQKQNSPVVISSASVCSAMFVCLFLEWNATGIFPEKFSYLCEGLNINTSLKSLDLRNNQLNHLCAQLLADVIYRNSSLQYLDLRWNSFGLIGGREILKALSKNKTILKLHIDGNDIPLEIQKSIEFITSVNAERYLKNSEDMKKTRLYLSKFQQLEGERNEQVKTLKDQLEKKDKVIESTERWNTTKLSELQEALMERDGKISELTKINRELQQRINVLTQEKNDFALTLNEVEMKNKEMKNEIYVILDKEKKEKEDIKRRYMEELGVIKEENMHLKQKIQEMAIMKETLDDEILNLKSSISKTEKMLKAEEKSNQEEISLLNEKHKDKLKEIEQEKKKEIIVLKEEFLEIEKNLKERITSLENRKRDLEKQIIEKNDLIAANKEHADKTINQLKTKMKENEDKLKKQMADRVELLESANKKLEELLKENLEGFYEIQKKSTETDLLLAEESRHTQELEHKLEAKDAEMNASIAKVKLEVRDQIDKLNQENSSLKLKTEEMEKLYKEEISTKDQVIENLEKKVSQLKMKLKEFSQNQNKRIAELQNVFVSYIKTVKEETDKQLDLEDEMGFNG